MKTSKIFISLSAVFCVALLFSCTSVNAPEPLPPIQQENTGSGSSGSGSGCTALNNTNTQYCSNGTMKTYGSTPEVGGRTYKTVVIGTQTWMAENLNYKTLDGTSRCHPGNINTNTSDADNANCNTYGRLYNWATAMGISSDYNSDSYNPSSSTNYRGVCPIGWHIPNNDEWNTLMNSVGGSSIAGRKLKSTSGWGDCGLGSSYSFQCEDAYGFSALPGGYGGPGGLFDSAGLNGNWWSASESSDAYSSYDAYSRYVVYGSEYVGYYDYGKSNLRSVRCLQD